MRGRCLSRILLRTASEPVPRHPEPVVVGVFEFILIIVLISTVGKVLTERRRPPFPTAPPERPALPGPEVERMREAMEDLAERVGRLEEERDFYRQLLENPARRESLGRGEGPSASGGG